MKNKILIFLKGFLMGVCDLVPGISGGTIAFITGIYERLINSVKSFSLGLVYSLLKGDWNEFKKDIRGLDLGFLVLLVLGILSAILLGSRVIKFLLDNFMSYTLSFFIGLILASSFIIFENIKNHSFKNLVFGFLGLILGVLSSFLIPMDFSPSLGYVFLGGFIAISAMFLPGISGAFILLIMGLYEFIINVLQDIGSNVNYIIVFGLGAVLGAVVISRLISFLFKKNKCGTLYFLLGLVVGSLSIPVRRVFSEGILGLSELGIMFALFFLGVLIVLVLDRYLKK